MIHRYGAHGSWSGSTGAGYERYDRTHTVRAVPAPDDVPAPQVPHPAGHRPGSTANELTLSADPAFRGDPRLLNPEQLVLMAALSCQMLAFLAVAARARIDVVAYEDDGVAEMPEDDPPLRITTIRLRPTITTGRPVDEERLRHLVEVAHRECFIANSLRTEITIHPIFVQPPPAD